jgi:O-antigen/teichoic acid export membrane protein
VAFVYFAIAGATTHKFTQCHVAGDKERLARFFAETIRWTFWPSLATCAAILALGRPLRSLFGASFESGYIVMFILAIGMLARAAVGGRAAAQHAGRAQALRRRRECIWIPGSGIRPAAE